MSGEQKRRAIITWVDGFVSTYVRDPGEMHRLREALIKELSASLAPATDLPSRSIVRAIALGSHRVVDIVNEVAFNGDHHDFTPHTTEGGLPEGGESDVKAESVGLIVDAVLNAVYGEVAE